jgi:hypothetical protein
VTVTFIGGETGVHLFGGLEVTNLIVAKMDKVEGWGEHALCIRKSLQALVRHQHATVKSLVKTIQQSSFHRHEELQISYKSFFPRS